MEGERGGRGREQETMRKRKLESRCKINEKNVINEQNKTGADL